MLARNTIYSAGLRNILEKFCKFDYAQLTSNQFFLSGHDYLLYGLVGELIQKVSDHSFFSKLSTQVRLLTDKTTSYVFHNADGNRYTYTQKRDTMKRLCRKAGVKFFGFHAIRHHVASILADSGKASLSQIQKMLRHRRTTTTDNYIKTLDPQLRQVANVLDAQGKVSKKIESSTIGSTI